MSILDLRAECQIIVYPWVEEFVNSGDEEPNYARLAKTYRLNVSRHLVNSVVFTKNIGSPAGAFNFKLDNSRDWKDVIKPGQWALLYMTQDGDLGAKIHSEDVVSIPDKPSGRLRSICYIERVSVNTSVDDTGVLDIYYEVSGRDLGVCYEETAIWYNALNLEGLNAIGMQERLQGLSQATLKELLETIHKLFYSPAEILLEKPPKTGKEKLEFTDTNLQWLLPIELCVDVYSGTGQTYKNTFFGNLPQLLRFEKTISTMPVVNLLSILNGNAWERLRQYSSPELHELFFELGDDGFPHLIFRPKPFGINPKGYPTIAGKLGETLSYKTFSESNSVEIVPEHLITASAGEDAHSRYNHFFTASSATLGIPEASIHKLKKSGKSQAGRTFPNIQRGSVRRHGFRPMHLEVDTLGQFTKQNTSDDAKRKIKVDDKTLLEVNELIYDYWNNAIFFESGTFQISGNPKVRVGKCLKFHKDVPYFGDKIFYIEEYSDEFTIDENGVGSWTQTITATRGIELGDLEEMNGFPRRHVPFKHSGDWERG